LALRSALVSFNCFFVGLDWPDLAGFDRDEFDGVAFDRRDEPDREDFGGRGMAKGDGAQTQGATVAAQSDH
jgi:hypothetical protein